MSPSCCLDIMVMYAHVKDTYKKNTWYFDTGAAHHLTSNKDLFSNYTPLATPVKVRFGNNGTIVNWVNMHVEW